MPLVYQQNINDSTRLGIWHITEKEDFFLADVPLQREITHPHKRQQHLAGRILLKTLFPDFPYEMIKIADTRKPFLENEMYHFSISHCGDYAAVIVSSVFRVGVDIEVISDKVQRVKSKFLNEDEKEMLDKHSAFINIENAVLTLCWSIKEAMFKWYGKGKIDFKDHLHINEINWKGERGEALCNFTKEISKQLTVHSFFYDGNCVSFVLSAH